MNIHLKPWPLSSLTSFSIWMHLYSILATHSFGHGLAFIIIKESTFPQSWHPVSHPWITTSFHFCFYLLSNLIPTDLWVNEDHQILSPALFSLILYSPPPTVTSSYCYRLRFRGPSLQLLSRTHPQCPCLLCLHNIKPAKPQT